MLNTAETLQNKSFCDPCDYSASLQDFKHHKSNCPATGSGEECKWSNINKGAWRNKRSIDRCQKKSKIFLNQEANLRPHLSSFVGSEAGSVSSVRSLTSAGFPACFLPYFLQDFTSSHLLSLIFICFTLLNLFLAASRLNQHFWLWIWKDLGQRCMKSNLLGHPSLPRAAGKHGRESEGKKSDFINLKAYVSGLVMWL